MDRKKIIIIVSVFLAVVLLILGWFFFFRGAPIEVPTGELPAGEFPTGGGGGGGTRPTGGGGTGTGELPTGSGSGLYQLVGSAISGSHFRISTTTITTQIGTTTKAKIEVATTTAVRYFDKSTGNLYEIKIDGSETKRLSNSTILRSFDVNWSPNAGNFIVEYAEPNDYGADNIKFFSARLSTSTESIDGEFLPANIASVTSSPAEDKIFYLTKGGAGTTGIISDFANKTKKSIFDFNFNEFNLSWSSKNIIGLNTKAAGGSEGFLYSLNAQTGSFSRLLGNIKGLTSLISPNGEWVLYSQNEGRALRTKVLSLKTKITASLDKQTLPEKCAWSIKETNTIYCAVPKKVPSQVYPDAWYQGLVSFDDTLWKINLASSTSEMLIETELDAINMQVDSENKYLIFTNKKDLSLWALKLAEQNI